MIQMSMQENSEDDLVIFEILAENLKLELDNILKVNHQYKTDYYRFNRKKFLLSYCFEPNNATNEYEINSYLDEIKKISAYKDYNSCFDKANRLISSTITYVTFKSNKLLERLKYNNQPNHAQIILNPNQNIQANTWQQVSVPTHTQNSIGINLNNIINNENVRLDRNNPNNTIVESNNYYTRDGGEVNSDAYDDDDSTEYNLVNESAQLPAELNAIHLNQQLFNFDSGGLQNSQINNQRGGTSDETFNNSNNNSAKKRSRLSQGEKRFVCEHCNKEFKLKHHLTRHLRQHTGEKPCVCEICGRSFTDESNFHLHMKTRHGDPELLKWKCDICQKRFAAKSGLDCHVSTHTTEKNFICEKCGKSFSNQHNLSHHLARHTDDRPFSCAHCDKKFKNSNALKTHNLTHTLERPFECDVCAKKFTKRHLLVNHKQIHDKIDKYECKICNEKFYSVINFRYHKRKNHKNVETNKTGQEIVDDQNDENDFDDDDEMLDEISESKIKSEPESMSESGEEGDNKSVNSKKNLEVKIKKVKLSFPKK